MSVDKNIKTEIDRYLKYNYSKKDVIAYLKRDGFSDTEIKENISVFNKADSNYFSNVLHFLPALLFLILTTLSLLGLFYSEEHQIKKVGFLLTIVALIYTTFGFCKNRPIFIITTGAMILISTIYYSYTFLIVSGVDEFGFSLSLSSKIIVLALHLLTLRGCYKIYKALN
jgi:hypothetical protein